MKGISNITSRRKPEKKVMEFVAVVFTLAVMALILPTATQAAGAETLHSSFKGLSAEALFFSTDPSGCIQTNVGIFPTDGRFKQTGKPETTSGAFIFIDQFDNCSGVLVIAASGSATLAKQDFQIDKQLNSATLNTTIEVFDFVSNTSFPLNVDVDWTGIGGSSSFKFHSQSKTPDFKVNTHIDGTSRNAEVSGSVTDGTTNFTLEDGFGGLSSVKSGDVDIIHF